MSNTTCQVECERWVRDVWLAQRYGVAFKEQNVTLTSGGNFKFDAVSEDGSILASISTSRAAMSSGKKGVGKLMKLRADMLFHVLAAAPHKLMVFTEQCMYQQCLAERARGRTPQDIEFVRVELPQDLAQALRESRDLSSKEVRPANRAVVV